MTISAIVIIEFDIDEIVEESFSFFLFGKLEIK